MKTAKQECLDLIGQLPDEASTEAIVAEREFKLLIEHRIERVENGGVVGHDEARKRLAKWLDSSGRDVKARIIRGVDQFDDGETVSQADVMENLEQWLKSVES